MFEFFELELDCSLAACASCARAAVIFARFSLTYWSSAANVVGEKLWTVLVARSKVGMACVTYMLLLWHALKTGMLQRRCAGIASRCMEVAKQDWSSALGCDTEIHMNVACVLSMRLSSAANVRHSDFWVVCQINMCSVAQWCDRVLSKTQSNKNWLGSWHACVHWAW